MFMRRRRSDRDFAEEIAAHLELEAEDLRAEGLSDAEAQRRARVAFNNAPLARERFRMRGQRVWAENVARDMRYSLRQLGRARGFAVTAILTLAVGLGANLGVFSLMDGLVLRPLPVPNAKALVLLTNRRIDGLEKGEMFPGPMFRALEKRHETLDSVAAFAGSALQVRGSAGLVELGGQLVSGQYFTLLRARPAMGRLLGPEDDVAGGANGYAVVISDGLWKSWFHGSPQVVGSRLMLEATAFTVVGVLPEEFQGAQADERVDVYVPLESEPLIHAPVHMLTSDGIQWLQIMGRRREGVSLEKVNAELRTIMPAVMTESVQDVHLLKSMQKGQFSIEAESGERGSNWLREEYERPLRIVFALCGGMLLLGCLNLASLMMARATARERELATRLAIGASRRRLIEQLLVESLVLAVLGVGAGLLIQPWVSKGIEVMMLRGSFRAVISTGMDIRIAGFAVIATIAVTLLTGLVPALRATSGDLQEQMKSGGLAGGKQRAGRSSQWLPKVLMGAEVGLALMLVIGAGLLATSLMRIYHSGLGFEPKGIVEIELNLEKQKKTHAEAMRWYEEYAKALTGQAGIEGVSFVENPPLGGNMEMYQFKTEGAPGGKSLLVNFVAPEYFSTLRTPMVAGRDFAWRSARLGGERQLILNESAAKALFPGREAMGQVIQPCEEELGPCRVVGVVRDMLENSIRKGARPEAYLAMTDRQDDGMWYRAIVRVKGTDGRTMTPAIGAARAVTRRMAAGALEASVITLDQVMDATLTTERMMAVLSVSFASAALLVTGIGLYGTLAYATARRTSEIGIRMALGAQRVQVVLLVFRENAWSTAVGAVAGLGIALAGARVLASFLYGTSVRDPWVLIGSVVALGGIASVASLLPAVRAARIDPMRALRAE